MRAGIVASAVTFLLLSSSTALAAPTSYSQDFSGSTVPAGWNSSSYFTVSMDFGALKVNINKNAGWQGLEVSLNGTYDFTINPVVNLTARGDVPYLLSVYFVDSAGNNILVQDRVHQVPQMHNFCFDLSTVTQPSGFNLSAITAMIFTPNGDGFSLAGNAWFSNLRVGGSATRFANMRAVPDQSVFHDTRGHSFIITDVANASSLTLSHSTLLTNISLSLIANGQSTLSYDCVPGVVGSETLTLTAHGTNGFADSTQTFNVIVNANNPPAIGPIPNQNAQVGTILDVSLSGISDGNPTADPALSFSAHSSNQTALPDSAMSVVHAAGSPYADLYLTTSNTAMGITVTITVDNGQPTNHLTSSSFTLNSYNHLNRPPTMDPISDQTLKFSGQAASVQLTGLGDGDNGSQTLSFSIASSNPAVLNPTNASVGPVTSGSAVLTLLPSATGTVSVTVTVADNGAGSDNGPLCTANTFQFNVIPLFPSSYIEPFSSLSDWSFAGTYTPSLSTFGGSPGLEINCTNKWYWDGYTLNFNPNLDLSQSPYLSMEVYSVGAATLHWMWFYDDSGNRNDNININTYAQWAPAGQWTKLLFNFSGYGQMWDGSGNPIHSSRITYALLNMHNAASSWPLPPNYSGTFYIRNVRVGSAADLGIPACTMNGVPDQVMYSGDRPLKAWLSGLSSGGTNQVVLTASSSNPALVPNPTVSPVMSDGTATLTCTTLPGTGRATITVTAQAPGSTSVSGTFTLDVLSPSPASFQIVTVNPTQHYQTIRGFGTFDITSQPQYFSDYTNDLGASAMRLGLIGNQLETNINNIDPQVLDRAKLDYSSFNFDLLKQLKDGGVQTFILTSWTPPAWMKDSLSEDYQQANVVPWADTDCRLSTNNYTQFAYSMVAAARVLQEQAGIALYGIGLQNEPAFLEPYGSAILDPAHFTTLIDVTGAAFAAQGIPIQLYMPEQVFGQTSYSMAQYISAVQADPVADAYCGVIATHGYANDGIQAGQPDYSQWSAMYQSAIASSHPKELWITETSPQGGTWAQALSLAGAMHGALAFGNVSLWTLWGIEGTLMQAGVHLPSYDTAKQYYRFIRPGYVRIGAAATNVDLLASAYSGGNNYAVVIVNKGTNSLPVQLAGTGLPPRLAAKLSSRSRSFQTFAVSNGVLAMPPQSVATIYANSGFEAWAASINWNGQSSNWNAVVSPFGLKNLSLYALNIKNPFSTNASKLPALLAGNGITNGSRREVDFEFRQNATAQGVTYSVLTSTDLLNWTTAVPDGSTITEDIADPNPDGDGSTVLMRYRFFEDSSVTKQFFGLSITDDPGASWGL